MHRPFPLRLALPLIAAALSSLAALAVARPPNVVLIVSDDQAWTDYAFMGHAEIRTPRLDRLAGEGLLFTRGYVPSSLCRPSLATLITGLYPHQHKITGNDPPPGVDRGQMLRHIRAVATLPRLLAERGYRSFQSGKWWEGSYEVGGFTAGMTHGDPARGGRHGDLGLRIGREGLRPIFDFIDGGESPFFVWYAPMLPHSPHNPPERLLAKYRTEGRSPHVARYYAMCEWFDETCGELLDGLESRGLADDTLVVYVTDNGWIQDPESRNFAPRSKRSPYEGGVRTPVILRWPGHMAPRRDEETIVSSIDLAPTILAACGIDAPAEMPGIDLLLNGARLAAERGAAFGQIFTHDVADLDRPAASLLSRWCVAGDWKLIVPRDPAAAVELFRVTDDPAEAADVADRHADLVNDLRSRLDRWWTPED